VRAWIKWILEQFHLAIDPKLGAACEPIAAKLRNGAAKSESDLHIIAFPAWSPAQLELCGWRWRPISAAHI
jgi:hypothetical protein